MTGLERTPQHPRIQDPGASLMMLQVRDVNAALDAVKKQGTIVITPGGVPLHDEKSKAREVLVADPDGFFVSLAQPDTIPSGSPDTLVIGASWATVVQDADKSARFYHDNFGFDVTTRDVNPKDPFLKVAGTPKAQYLAKGIQVPGTSRIWWLYEFRNIDRKPVHFKVPDPGSLQLGFQVRDIDAAVAAFRSAGGAVVSTGGEVMRRPNGGGGGLVRDPDGVYLEVGQQGTRAPAPQSK